jgi:hypothetical protein
MASPKGSKDKKLRKKRIGPNKGQKLIRICVNGHDTFVCGRDKWHQCRECGKMESKIYYDEHKIEIIAKRIQWQKNNPEKVKAINNTERRKKYIEEYNRQYAAKKKEWVKKNLKGLWCYLFHKTVIVLNTKE